MINATSLLFFLKDPWILSWFASGLAAIIIPLIIWSSQRSVYFMKYGSYNKAQDYYEEQQRYYKQQQEYYEQQQNGNYYYGYGNQNQSYYKECSWINWICRKRQWQYATYSQDGGNGDEVTQEMPGWYIFLGGETEAMQRWKEENTGERADGSSSTKGMGFVYFLTLCLFIALLAYGAMSIAKREPITTMMPILVFSAVIGFMNLIMSVNTISSDDRDMEDSYYGWYGQMGVLMVYTNFWMMLFSFAFMVVFTINNYLGKKMAEKEDEGIEEEGESEAKYYAPSAE